MNIDEILEKHSFWLNDLDGGERADLSGADLSGADLSRANLSWANLSRADLRRANLSRANLRRANLSGADLSGADLSGADLSGADLRRADLSGADLCWANLSRADLRRANLSGADLQLCPGNRAEIKSVFAIGDYPITYTSEYLQIGCERHLISKWWLFDDQTIIEMDGKKALKFWREWKETIRMIIEKSPATPTSSIAEVE